MRIRLLSASIGALLVAASSLAACGGGHGNTMPPLPSGVQPYSGPSQLAKFDWGADAMKQATYVGPAHFRAMGVNVAVSMQDAQGLVRYAQDVSDPKSAVYRRFLTPKQIGDRFGARTGDYTSVAAYFAKQGLHVGGWPQRFKLFVSGTQPALERAFGTTFGVYQRNGNQFVAPLQQPHFGSSLAVTAVSQLVTAQRQARDFVPVRAGNDKFGGYSPGQLRKVFDYTSAYSDGFTGAGINVGIIGTGPISAADVPAFGQAFHVNVANVQQVVATDQGVAAGIALNSPQPNPSASPPYTFPYNIGLQSPPPTTDACQDVLPQCNAEDVEAQIDTEQAASLAPGANVLFYIAYNPGECFAPGPAVNPGDICPSPGPNAGQPTPAMPAIGLALADDEIEQAIADNKADVLSLSYGGPEQGAAGLFFDPNAPGSGVAPAEFAALASEGVAIFVSSGDAGAEGCQRPFLPGLQDQPCVSYPAGDPSVVSVGGVTAPMNQFGQLTSPMTAWGVQTSAGSGGTGGGVSQYFPMPPWQKNIPGVQGAMRNQPDISLQADSSTGVATLINAAFPGRQIGSVGGTSVAAPEMAAMWALVLQACSQSSTCNKGGDHGYRLGNPNPLLYGLYYANGAANPQYSSVFYDVLFGNNAQGQIAPGPTPMPTGQLDQGYNAGTGYDLTTGLGVPFARNLIKAVTGQ
jgi:subtilase family serine protease